MRSSESQPQPSIENVLMVAVERGVDADTMEKLVNLQLRVMEKNAEMAFNRAFQDFQAECPSVSKNRTAKIPVKGESGKSWGYDFADLNHIAAVVKPHLKRHGFSFTFDTDGAGAFRCHLHHVDGHSRTASVTLPAYKAAQINDLQSEGVRNSYGRRYALLSVLGITTGDEDADGALPDDEPQRRPQRAPVEKDELTAMIRFWKSQNERGTEAEFRQQISTMVGIPPADVMNPKHWDRPTLEMCQRNLGMTSEQGFSV